VLHWVDSKEKVGNGFGQDVLSSVIECSTDVVERFIDCGWMVYVFVVGPAVCCIDCGTGILIMGACGAVLRVDSR
jgi:hypothetical protein